MKLLLPEKPKHLVDSFGDRLFDKVNPVILEIYDSAGNLKDYDITHNGITVGGKNDLFEQAFRAGTQRATWYFGLIDNATPTTNDTTDTMGSHTWTENVAYSESTRPQWSPGAASGASITNSSSVTFTVNATGTLYGMFVTTVNTKGGTTGVLWSTAAFNTAKSVSNGDSVKLTYTLSA